jgi:histidyl-tRNA synthetase
MVGSRAAALPKPIRWFSIPQLFRYERPQKGRLREHFQLNLDIVGEAGELADAEIVAAGLDILRAFGLDASDVVARISDRRLAGGVLEAVGLPAESVPAAFAALDKMDRESEDWVRERLAEAGAPEGAADRIMALGSADLDGVQTEFGKHPDVAAGVDRLRRVFDHLEALGLGAFTAFDPALVRGLAYYTGTVFELWDRRGEFRAICGGGRYDGLLAAVGGPDLPALGFGMGDVVLGELLRARGLVPSPEPAAQDFLVCVTSEQRALALRVAHALRERGRRVVYDLTDRSVGRQFRAADQAGAVRTIVLGPDEEAEGVALVREMESGTERRVPLSELIGDG